LAAAASTIAALVTHSRLLEMIVETAAHAISARAAALFFIDEEAQELVFEVALGSKAEEAKKFRVPLGHGIAGLVAVSGQPMAVSDAESNPHQAADIARSVGYTPQSILCVPLFLRGARYQMFNKNKDLTETKSLRPGTKTGSG
jgi:signal transduction protein with GAF and PtsI domain